MTRQIPVALLVFWSVWVSVIARPRSFEIREAAAAIPYNIGVQGHSQGGTGNVVIRLHDASGSSSSTGHTSEDITSKSDHSSSHFSKDDKPKRMNPLFSGANGRDDSGDCEVYKNEVVHSLMDNICDACHNMFHDPNLRMNCRKECFDNSVFRQCASIFTGGNTNSDSSTEQNADDRYYRYF